MKFVFFHVLTLASCFLNMSCAHSVRMISVPPGAKITVDEQSEGKAPFLYHEKSGAPTRTFKIKAELPGYPTMVKEETVRVCTTPGNLVLDSYVVGFLFGFCLRDEYVFDFTAKAPVGESPRTQQSMQN